MTQKTVFPDQVWVGTEHSLQLAIANFEALQAGLLSPSAQTEEKDAPWNFELTGTNNDIGVVSVRGPLVNNDSPYNRYLNQTSYADVRRAMIHAATSPDVKAILLDINSGGGAVSGVDDTGNLISMINRNVKPVYAYTEGVMASAAYWLGVSAGEVYNARTAVVGSIGVITTHMDLSKMFKEMGIGVTVIRAGEFKALGHPFEALTDKALAQIQGQLNAMYGVFIGHVASHLGMTVEAADSKLGQGREFVGQDAVAVGLSKGIESFDSLIGKIGAKIETVSGMTQSHFGNNKDTGMGKRALTEQQMLAAQAGLDAATGADPEKPENTPAPDAAKPEATAPDAAKPEVTESEPAKDTELVKLLQTQLATSQAEVVKLKVDAGLVTRDLDALKASVDPMKAIVAASVSQMKVALGMPKVDMTSMSVDTLVAEHKATSESFLKAFKAGGVAAVNTEDATKPAAAAVDPNHMQRVGATRLS